MARAYRSVLYMPAANPRAMEKAQQLPADAIIFDLEDAVAPAAKIAAREQVVTALETNDYGSRLLILRINGLDTEWGSEDLRLCAGPLAGKIHAVLIPKVNGTADLDRVADIIPETPLWAMMETPLGMLNASEIATHPRLEGMVMGTNDLAKEIGSRFRADRLPMLAGLGLCLLAAKAHDRIILDGVFNAIQDEDGLRFECEQGRDMGFDGKTLIHPAQLAIANDSFAPTAEEIDLARRQIEGFEQALTEGKAVAVVDGKIVENLHVETARKTLDRAEAIAAMAG
ncbi:HpcH/HpaI aldolase/citrate lyase family protein [Paracoccus onubensis]|uniref:CoA ester lyase n=1 Tax=Paracoccus onubensis TaxID=1675788 RepID=A0A418SSH6_9RHOB|nr:CoA ester lyase [Paracoccus onubensis]RJE83838.1 CoA ester lyase [Paracoccus onubensis]